MPPTTISLRHISKVFITHEPLAPTGGGIRQVFSGLRRDRLSRPPEATALPETPTRLYALDDITLTVHPAETLAVLGPSGSGKTTLLRIVAGLSEPTSGEVLFDGQNMAGVPAGERGIGMVFQSYALYPHLPSVDNIGFFLKLRKREHEIPARVKEISRIMRLDLEPLLGRKPPTLSGGERQRVAIARCLARDPRVFLFDEPFANLDAKVRTESRVELKRLLHRYSVTSIYVTHDQMEAIALADRIAILSEGRLVQIGTYSHLYDTPVHIFVAGFFGRPPMNLLPGRAVNGMWEGETFTWGPIRADLDQDHAVVLGIRPEHFRLDDEGAITAVVRLTEPLFSEREQLVYVTVGSRQATARLPLSLSVKRGEVLRLSPRPDQVHLFDQHTGVRLG